MSIWTCRARARVSRRWAALLISLTAVIPTSAVAVDPFTALNLTRPPRPTAAPDFTVSRLGSGAVGLQARRQLIFLNFWATWCPPCREEMPAMQRLYGRYKDRGFTILAISIDTGAPGTVDKFAKALGLTFPIGLDPKLEIANRYSVRALPSSFLIDDGGKIAAVALGPSDWDTAPAHMLVETLLPCGTSIAAPGGRDRARC